MTSASLAGLYPNYGAPRSTPMSQAALKALYPNPAPLSLSHLSRAEIESYTAILSHHPPITLPPDAPVFRCYRQETTRLISELAGHLLNPTPLPKLPEEYLTKLFRRVGANDALPPPAHLCKLHSKLNAQIVADALGAIEMEVEDFLPRLLKRVGVSNVSDEMLNLVQSAENVMATSLVQQEFCHYNRRSPPPEWIDNSGGCDACILARVGSASEVLVAFRAIMMARMPMAVLRAEKRSPRLDMVEGWMKGFGSEESNLMKERSGRCANELIQLRDAKAAVDTCELIKHGAVEKEVQQRKRHQLLQQQQQPPALTIKPGLPFSPHSPNHWPKEMEQQPRLVSQPSSIYSPRPVLTVNSGANYTHSPTPSGQAANCELSIISEYVSSPTLPLPPLTSPSLHSSESAVHRLARLCLPKQAASRRSGSSTITTASSSSLSPASWSSSCSSITTPSTPPTPFSGLSLTSIEAAIFPPRSPPKCSDSAEVKPVLLSQMASTLRSPVSPNSDADYSVEPAMLPRTTYNPYSASPASHAPDADYSRKPTEPAMLPRTTYNPYSVSPASPAPDADYSRKPTVLPKTTYVRYNPFSAEQRTHHFTYI